MTTPVHTQRSSNKERLAAVDTALNKWAASQASVMSQQTSRQPVVWRCPNPRCKEKSSDRFYDFVADEESPACPKCGLKTKNKRTLIHMVIPASDGLIPGDMGIPHRIVCEPMRQWIATERNGEAGTADLNRVNCPGCLSRVGQALMDSHVKLQWMSVPVGAQAMLASAQRLQEEMSGTLIRKQ